MKNPRIFLNGLLNKTSWIFSDKRFLKLKYRLRFGKSLDLKNPKTFSEKIQWLKLYNRKSEYHKMVDKASAKDYVASILGEKYIIPTYGVWESFDEIDFDSLPEKFVLKTTNGGGHNGVVICKEKNNFDKKYARKLLETSARKNIYRTLREWPYKGNKSRFLAERMLEFPGEEDLYDYKFFCFNSKPLYCQVVSGRSTPITCFDMFDRNWNHLPFREPEIFPNAKTMIYPPANIEEMWNLAEMLAQKINSPFVRLDFYNVQGKIYFGEITFFPTSGFGGFSPEEWDLKFGKLIMLPIVGNER